MPRIKLLTKADLERLPKIGATECPDTKTGDKIVYVKWFTPDSNWTWFCLEYDPDTGLCYGLVDGFEAEFGYWSLDEIKEARGPLGMRIERDIHWQPKTLREIDACPEWAKR